MALLSRYHYNQNNLIRITNSNIFSQKTSADSSKQTEKLSNENSNHFLSKNEVTLYHLHSNVS